MIVGAKTARESNQEPEPIARDALKFWETGAIRSNGHKHSIEWLLFDLSFDRKLLFRPHATFELNHSSKSLCLFDQIHSNFSPKDLLIETTLRSGHFRSKLAFEPDHSIEWPDPFGRMGPSHPHSTDFLHVSLSIQIPRVQLKGLSLL